MAKRLFIATAMNGQIMKDALRARASPNSSLRVAMGRARSDAQVPRGLAGFMGSRLEGDGHGGYLIA